MGGFFGHICYPFEDRTLSFSKLKKILSDISLGKVPIIEKIDGFQNYFSFNDGKALSARNKSEISNNGLDDNLLSQKNFEGGDKIKKLYLSAHLAFEKAINSISPEIQEKLFQNGTIWYNCEIISKFLKNVINYDQNSIIIHNLGTLKVNSQTKEIISFENMELFKLFDKAMEQIDQQTTNLPFYICKDNIFKIKKSDPNDLKIVIAKINKIIENNSLSDKDTIEDLLKINILKSINEQLPELSKEIKKIVIENILGNEKLSLPLGISKEAKQKIYSLKKEGKINLKNCLFPLEEAINDFSIDLLKGLESIFILNNQKEIENRKKEVSQIIKSLQNSNNQEVLDKLSKQFTKLKSVDGIDTSIEGIVFNYDGKIYKLTGTFAPINQIMNLFKYGGKEKQEETLEEELGDDNKKRIVVIPGSFKPPHRGHYEVVKYFYNMPKIDEIHVFISPKERIAHGIDRRISIIAEMSKKIWEIYTKNDPKIKIQITNNHNPTKAVYDFVVTLNPDDILIIGQGKKEEGNPRFNNLQEWADKTNLGIKTKVVSAPIFAEGISGTLIREIIAEEQKEKFINLLPQHLNGKEKNIIWKIVNTQPLEEDFQADVKKHHSEKKNRLVGKGNEPNTKPYSFKPSMKRSKSAPVGYGALEEDEINEISAMSGGAIAGSNLINKKEDKYMKSRKEFVENLILRENINKLIKEVYNELIIERKESIIKKNKLRKFICSIIKEVKQDENIPEGSTGINVLRDLLKKIIPVIEMDYKFLTTSKEQRLSFRAHILKAIKSSLILGHKDIAKQTNKAEQQRKEEGEDTTNIDTGEEELKEQDNNKINVNVNNSDKEEETLPPQEDIGVEGEPSSEKFIDIKTKPYEDVFTIPGQDMTGRNMALSNFEKIEKNIVDAYGLLGDEEDQYLFVDYLMTNLKMYFDKFEDELNPMVDEPTSQTYDQEKDKLNGQEELSQDTSEELPPEEQIP